MADLALIENRFNDWEWRINNLYYITDRNGKKVRFTMNRAQRRFFKKMWYRNIILKAKQLGFTTFMLIFMLDACLFAHNTKCALIAHTREVASRLFREKVKYAYDNLDREIREAIPAKSDRAGEMVFANGSSITVDTSFRGGTLRYLHISEFGKICRKYPDKAEEIVTGSFEAVGKNCVITIESTAEGKSGYFYKYATEAEKLALAEARLTQLDWRFFFYPWYDDPEYQLDDDVAVPQRLVEYFYELKTKHGIALSHAQQAWYVKKELAQGDKIKQEYPSTPQEAFDQSIEGAYYARAFLQIYEQKRICSVPHEPAVAVHTMWDIGHGDSTAIWFVQRVGRAWHVIDYFENNHEGLGFYLSILEDKRQQLGYHYGSHIGPHDMEVHEWGADGKTRWEQAKSKGYTFEIAPKLSIEDGIEAVRSLLPLCWFDEARCNFAAGKHDPGGLAKLQEYRKEWDDRHGMWKNKPLHDHCSHAADAFRYFAVATHLLGETINTFSHHQQQEVIPTSAWT